MGELGGEMPVRIKKRKQEDLSASGMPVKERRGLGEEVSGMVD